MAPSQGDSFGGRLLVLVVVLVVVDLVSSSVPRESTTRTTTTTTTIGEERSYHNWGPYSLIAVSLTLHSVPGMVAAERRHAPFRCGDGHVPCRTDSRELLLEATLCGGLSDGRVGSCGDTA